MSPVHRPHPLRVIWAVGKVTLLELVRDRILYNSVLLCFFLLALAFFASRLTFIRPERVVLDFGLSSVSLSCALIAVLLGSQLLNREFERRTIHVALCHPITRLEFVIGKFVGLASVLALNWLLLASSYLVVLGYSSESFFENTSPILMVGLVFCLIQSLILAGFAILFSSFSTTALSVMFSVGVFLIGNNVTQLRLVGARVQSQVGSLILKGASYVLPNLESFNLGLQVTYGLPPDWKILILSTLYGFFVLTLVLGLSGAIIQFREV